MTAIDERVSARKDADIDPSLCKSCGVQKAGSNGLCEDCDPGVSAGGVDWNEPTLAEQAGPLVLSLPISQVVPSPLNPRRHFDRDSLAELAESIKAHGVQQPIVVRPLSFSQQGQWILDQGTKHRGPKGQEKVPFWRWIDGTKLDKTRQAYTGIYLPECWSEEEAQRHRPRWQIVMGERRWRAALQSGLAEIPALVREDLDDASHLEIALVENLQRRDISAVEEAQGYQRLVDLGHKQVEIAAKVGRKPETISNAMRLLRLPADVLEMIEAGKLTAAHGRALARWADHPAAVSGIAAWAAEKEYASKILEKGIPDAYTLQNRGVLVRMFRHSTRWDMEAVCGACPFGAFVQADGETLCLRPDHHRQMEAEAEARAKEKAQAAVKAQRERVQADGAVEADGAQEGQAPELPRLSDLDWHKFRRIHRDAPAGCSADCKCRGMAIGYDSQPTPICLDPACYDALEAKARQAKKDAIKAKASERLQAAIAALDGIGQDGEDDVVALRRAAVVAILPALSGEAGYLAATAKRRKVKVDAKGLRSSARAQVMQGLSHQATIALVLLAAETQLRREAALMESYESAESPLMDFLLHGHKEPEDAAPAEGAGTPAAESPTGGVATAESGLVDMDCARCGIEFEVDLSVETTKIPGDAERYPNGALVTSECCYCPACGPSVQICRVCGCTDEAACVEGCSWVEADLCSSCVEEDAAASPEAWDDGNGAAAAYLERNGRERAGGETPDKVLARLDYDGTVIRETGL